MNYFIELHLLKNKDYDEYNIIKYIKNNVLNDCDIPLFNSNKDYIIGKFHDIHFENNDIIIHIEPSLLNYGMDTNIKINYEYNILNEDFIFFI